MRTKLLRKISGAFLAAAVAFSPPAAFAGQRGGGQGGPNGGSQGGYHGVRQGGEFGGHRGGGQGGLSGQGGYHGSRQGSEFGRQRGGGQGGGRVNNTPNQLQSCPPGVSNCNVPLYSVPVNSPHNDKAYDYGKGGQWQNHYTGSIEALTSNRPAMLRSGSVLRMLYGPGK